MSETIGGTKQAYRRERIQRGRVSLIISCIALAVSTISVYETALKQPILSLHVTSNWGYSRLQAGGSEVVFIPISVVNHGARPGVVRTFKLLLSKGNGGEKAFESGGFTQGEKALQLFAPLTIQPHASTTATVMFATAPGASDSLFVNGSGDYAAQLVMCTVFDRDYGFIDDWTKTEPNGLSASLRISNVGVKFDGSYFNDQQVGPVKAREVKASPSDGCHVE